MKPNQSQLCVNLPASKSRLQSDLFSHLNAHPQSDNDLLVALVNVGLQVKLGRYHDFELAELKAAIQTEIARQNQINQKLDRLAVGQVRSFNLLSKYLQCHA